MNSWPAHPLRVTVRLLWLGAELLWAAFGYLARCAWRRADSQPQARARWLQTTARRVLQIFGASLQTEGPIPQSGLLVCNHLSYLDILVLASLSPCVFVAKSEVRRWPVFGWFARLAGTVFVERERRTTAAKSADEVNAALRTGRLVVLFPEGTSSGGETVLAFKSALLEPATGTTHALTAGCIAYQLPEGDVSEEVCYWKDMTLVPHLINLLGKRGVRASVRFTQLQAGSTNRKELARQLHSEVLRLKESPAV